MQVNQIPSSLLARCLALLTCIIATASSADAFNFAYRSTGDSDLKPIQTFDDGERTFLQMRNGLVPAVFVDVDGKSIMLKLSRNGQYLVAHVIANEITIQFANRSAKVVYSGVGRSRAVVSNDAVSLPESSGVDAAQISLAERLPPAAPTYGASKPSIGDEGPVEFLDRDALIPFAKGKANLSLDAVSRINKALSGGPGAVFKVVILGRDDQAYVEGLARARSIAIRDRVLAAGVPLDRVVLKEGVARDSESTSVFSDVVVTWKTEDVSLARLDPAPAARKGATPAKVRTPHGTGTVVVANASRQALALTTWKLRATDENVQNVLQRWASDAGWRLVWKNGPEVKVTGDAELLRDGFASAADYLIAQARSSGYRIKGRAYTNKVLVVSID